MAKKLTIDDKGRVTNSLHFPHLYSDEDGLVIALRLPYHLRYIEVIIGQNFLAYHHKIQVPEGWSMMPREAAFYAHSRWWQLLRKKETNYYNGLLDRQRYPLVKVNH